MPDKPEESLETAFKAIAPVWPGAEAMKEKADRAGALASRTPEAKKEDLPAVASGGSYL